MTSIIRKSESPDIQTPATLGNFGSWSDAHTHFRGLLYSALSRLAARGYVTSLEEGRDLVLDFFLEEWDGLKERHDPLRARPATYVYRAFVLYARPKIRQLMRWKNSLTDVGTLVRQAENEDSSLPADSVDLELVRQALTRLPTGEREVLESSLNDRASLTQLANQRSITRYHARQLLCDAFGRLLVDLGERQALSELEWRVALSVWREGKLPRDAARELDATTAQIQACRSKVLNIIGRGVRAANRRTKRPVSSRRTTVMAVMIPTRPVDELVRLAILRGSPEDWGNVRERREEVLKMLDNEQLELSLEEQRVLDDRPQILVKLLGTLGDDQGLSADERASLDSLIAAQERDEESVGSAFMHVLWPGLSPRLRQLENWFGDAPTLEKAEREELRSRADVRAASKDGQYPDALLRHGVTPLTLLYATQSPWNVYDDLRRSHEIRGDRLIMAAGDNGRATIPTARVVQEIALLAECGRSLAGALYQFCFATAVERHAYLMEGFEAKAEGESMLSLRPIERKSLVECWHPAH